MQESLEYKKLMKSPFFQAGNDEEEKPWIQKIYKSYFFFFPMVKIQTPKFKKNHTAPEFHRGNFPMKIRDYFFFIIIIISQVAKI